MPLRDIEHAISSAQSNELIEWQTGKLFAYLTLRNSHINVTFKKPLLGWSIMRKYPDRLGENNKGRTIISPPGGYRDWEKNCLHETKC